MKTDIDKGCGDAAFGKDSLGKECLALAKNAGDMRTESKHGNAVTLACTIQTKGVSLSHAIEAAIVHGVDPDWFAGDSQTHRYEVDSCSGPTKIIEHTIYSQTSVVVSSYEPTKRLLSIYELDDVVDEFEDLVFETVKLHPETAGRRFYHAFPLRGSFIWILSGNRLDASRLELSGLDNTKEMIEIALEQIDRNYIPWRDP